MRFGRFLVYTVGTYRSFKMEEEWGAGVGIPVGGDDVISL